MMNVKIQMAIEVFENKLRDKLYRQHNDDFLFADLSGLCFEIMDVVAETDKAKIVIFYDYVKLLEQDLHFYSGVEAYIAGREAKDKSENEVITAYIKKIVNISNERRLYRNIQTLFDEISKLLGNSSGLITEFTETYREIHGVIVNNIHEFIRLGQTSNTDMTAE